jgi:hypothetical protein
MVMGIKTFRSTLFSSLGRSFLSQGRSFDHRPLLSLGLAAAAVGIAVPSSAQAQAQVTDTPVAVAQTTTPTSHRYLFGQSAQPNQIGQGYVVLERTGDRVYGALYFPSSSFDCFHGQVQGTELAMTIINSYDQDAYGYSMALAEGPVVAANSPSGEVAPFGLDGFHALSRLSDNDHRMLEACRTVVAPGQ